MTEENPCETTPKHGVSGQADRTAHPPKSPTISTPDAGKTDRTEREPSEKVGKPGSLEAVAMGCECPVLDNNHGGGIERRGERVWWISSQCPMHGDAQNRRAGGGHD